MIVVILFVLCIIQVVLIYNTVEYNRYILGTCLYASAYYWLNFIHPTFVEFWGENLTILHLILAIFWSVMFIVYFVKTTGGTHE